LLIFNEALALCRGFAVYRAYYSLVIFTIVPVEMTTIKRHSLQSQTRRFAYSGGKDCRGFLAHHYSLLRCTTLAASLQLK
jgi:hypothetical protein